MEFQPILKSGFKSFFFHSENVYVTEMGLLLLPELFLSGVNKVTILKEVLDNP